MLSKSYYPLLIIFGLIAGVSIFFTGVGADSVSITQDLHHARVGFWYGVWHGAIVLYTFIISIFDHSRTIYAVYNDGIGYNAGFMLGCIGIVNKILGYALFFLARLFKFV